MTTPDEQQFETVADESPDRIIFDTFGDQFVGTYVGPQMVDLGDDEEGKYLVFRQQEDQHLYMMSASYKLDRAFAEISPGALCRITYVKDIEVGNGRNPMKDFKVEVAK